MLLLHFPKSGGSSGVREATAIVAASDSVHKDKADYVCTGGSDQNKITQAINDLPSRGGTVYLMEGTYYFSGAIGILNKDRVRLVGCGPSTLLYKPGSGSIPTMFINVKNSDDVIISNIAITGNEGWHLAVQNCNTVTINGLIFGNNSRLYVMSGTENITVENCVFHGWYMSAAYMNKLRIQNNIFYVPLDIDHSNDVIVEGNTFYSVSDPYSQFTIKTSAPSNVVIANNTFSSIYRYNIIQCNGGSNYTISNNVFKDICYGSDNQYTVIKLSGVTDSSVMGNVITTTQTNKPKYCILEEGSSDYNIILGNVARAYSTAGISTVGANTINVNNIT